MAEKCIFGRAAKLQNVSERLNYTNALKDESKRENEYLASYDTVSEHSEPAFSYWEKLAAFNQERFRTTANYGRTYLDHKGDIQEYQCVEAREQIIELPNEWYDPYTNYDALAKSLAEIFKDIFKCECNVAVHINDTKTNLHAHVIFSERESVTEKKVASRNLFFDENNKRRYKKSEILNEDGSIRDGCRIVKKGTELSEYIFSSKNSYLKSNAFTEDVKREFAKIFNENLNKDKYQVFDRSDIYIAQKKILDSYGSNTKKRLKAENQKIREYNSTAKQLLNQGYDRSKLLERKNKVLEEAKTDDSTEKYHYRFMENLREAIRSMREILHELKLRMYRSHERSRSIEDRMRSASREAEMKNRSRTVKKRSRDDFER